MNPETLTTILDESQAFFERSTRPLTEEDSTFAPVDGLFTPAQIVAHVAVSMDWFVDGAFVRSDGFSMDFEALDGEAKGYTSLESARAKLRRSFDHAREVVGRQTAESLAAPLPEGPIMGGQPRGSVIQGIQDHNAHHRGALTMYSRLRGHTPPMPYAEEG